MLEGIIIKNISNLYTVAVGNVTYDCVPRGRFRKEKKTPLVGDRCKIDAKEHYILELLPRKNELSRPSVANTDYALIVTSLKKPDFSSLLLDKELSCIILANIKPVICFTKEDLLTEEETKQYQEIRAYYTSIGVPCFSNTELKELLKFLQNSIVVLTGQTGAGKTTILNRIAPELNLKTNEISAALNRGKHTTRHTEIHVLNGVWFCDTPGFSSLELRNYTKEEIKNSFIEFSNYSCYYRDCMHKQEPDCGVKKALEEGKILKSRYENYQKIEKEESL